ncbi:MAG: GNAT family N-acetyltransferase [Thalassobaculaceae bacterium]
MVQISINNDGTIIIADENTTIGYVVTDTSKDELSYLFVNPAFRRRGFGTLLLKEAEKMAGKNLFPAEPISPLGRKFFNHNSHVECDKNRTLESRRQQSVLRDLTPNE